MLDDNLEKYLKDNLESARLSWDKEAMWDDIEAQLPPEKKRRIVAWYWLGTVVAILFGAFVGLKYLAATQSTVSNGTLIANQNVDSNQSTEEEETNFTNKTITTVKSNEVDGKSSTNKKLNQETLNSILNLQKRTETNLKIESSNSTKFEKEIRSRKNKLTVPKQAEIIFVPTLLKKSKEDKNPKIVMESKVGLVSNLDNLPTKRLEEIMIKTNEIQEEFVLETKLVSNENISKIPFFTIGTYASIGQVQRNLTNTSNEEDLFNLRESTEQTLEAWSAGIILKKALKNRLFVQTGLEFSTINERLTYDENQIETFTIESDSAYNYQSYSGARVFKKGEVQAQSVSTTHFTRYNAHRFWNIPVYIGYQLPFKKLRLSAAAGPVFTVHQSAKGYAYQDDQTVLPLTRQQILNNSKLYSVDFQLEGSCQLNDNYNIFLGLQYRKGISGFSLNTGIQQQYNVVAIKLGAAVQF